MEIEQTKSASNTKSRRIILARDKALTPRERLFKAVNMMLPGSKSRRKR